MADYRAKRIFAEVAGLLLPKFGDVHFDDEDFSWVHIERFPLPSGWNSIYTPLLIWLPANYPQFPPTKFSIRQGLVDEDGLRLERRRGETAEAEKKGWTGFCYTFRSNQWTPSNDIVNGDNLLTVTRIIFEVLNPENMGG